MDDIACCWGGQNNASSRSWCPRDQHWCYWDWPSLNTALCYIFSQAGPCWAFVKPMNAEMYRATLVITRTPVINLTDFCEFITFYTWTTLSWWIYKYCFVNVLRYLRLSSYMQWYSHIKENAGWRPQHKQNCCDHVQQTFNLVAFKILFFKDREQIWEHLQSFAVFKGTLLC